MANYTNLDNPSVNITRLIKEQNDAGWTAGSFSGKEPFEVLISKSTFSLKQQIDAFITDALPSLTGNSGKVLTNNGTVASWTDSPSLSSLSASGAATVGSLVTSVITGSPTISGNLTVSGTGTHTFAGVVRGTQMYGLAAAAGTSGYFTDATNSTLYVTHPSSGVMSFKNGSNATWLSESSTNVTLAGNLTVSGTYAALTNGVLHLDNASGSYFVQKSGTTVNHAVAGVIQLALTGTSATIAGNLIVSGTGISTVAGPLSSSYVSGAASFLADTATVNRKYIKLGNTGGDLYLGNESSTAGGFFTGVTAYGAVVYSTSSNIHLVPGALKAVIFNQLLGTAVTLDYNSSMTFELTSNTSLSFKVRGTDGVTRTGTLTLS